MSETSEVSEVAEATTPKAKAVPKPRTPRGRKVAKEVKEAAPAKVVKEAVPAKEGEGKVDPRMPVDVPESAFKKPLKPSGGEPGDWAYKGLLTGWDYRAVKGKDDNGKDRWVVSIGTHDGPVELSIRAWHEVYEFLTVNEHSRGEVLRAKVEELATEAAKAEAAGTE